MAKATKDKDAAAQVAANAEPAVETVEQPTAVPPEAVKSEPPAVETAPAAPAEPELKEFVCDMPQDGRPPGVSVVRTVKAKDKYDACEVYLKTLGIIETHYRPVVREKVAGE